MEKLSKMQQRVYTYIVEYVRAQGYAPSVREIGQALRLSSPSTVHFHIRNLEQKGLLTRSAGKGRALALTERGAAEALPPEPQELSVEEEIPRGRIPILGQVAAGQPILAEENVEDYLLYDANGREEECFALRVRGDSMQGAGIFSGDLVVVRQQKTAQSGEIVVALFEDEATVKTLRRHADGSIWLMPENPAYEPLPARGAQLLGKVIALVRRY